MLLTPVKLQAGVFVLLQDFSITSWLPKKSGLREKNVKCCIAIKIYKYAKEQSKV